MRLSVVLLSLSFMVWAGCRPSNSDKPQGGEIAPQEKLIVVASKLFESHTYEDYLQSLVFPGDSLVCIDASRVGPNQLDSLLLHAHAVLLLAYIARNITELIFHKTAPGSLSGGLERDDV